ncbi:MAG: RNA polymerase factor sigma-54 [Lentisphaeraceae bacterium]|nr:RNA polymerase factor sigma-54 [Lentisphaeraceae bacterium]
MEQGLFQSQKLSQELIMAPQQIQSLEILLLPMLELQQKISQEIEVNPTLEVSGGGEELMGDMLSEDLPGSPSDEQVAAAAAEHDESMCSLISIDPSWRDHAGSGGNSPEADSKRQHFFDSLTEESSLQDILVEQLRSLDLDEKDYEIAEQLIGSIDELGYLRTHISDLAIICGCDVKVVKKVLQVIQSFEPIGVGSRDLQECLCIQLKKMNMEATLEYKIISKHLDMVQKNHIPQLAKKLNVTPTKIYEALKFVQKLKPYPGSAVTNRSVQYAVPETEIYKDGEEFKVKALKEHLPNLRISDQYLTILEDPNTKPEVRKYIKEKITSSKMLMRSLDHRESTIVRITQVLTRLQDAFLREGVDLMKPLTMQQVADEIGVHETTVSRAINQKYVQTPKGLFPFKYFFNSGYTSTTGEVVTSLSIKHRINEMIAEEDSKKPLADQELVDGLNALGFSIARRTVAKYREELGIASSHLRRSY